MVSHLASSQGVAGSKAEHYLGGSRPWTRNFYAQVIEFYATYRQRKRTRALSQRQNPPLWGSLAWTRNFYAKVVEFYASCTWRKPTPALSRRQNRDNYRNCYLAKPRIRDLDNKCRPLMEPLPDSEIPKVYATTQFQVQKTPDPPPMRNTRHL